MKPKITLREYDDEVSRKVWGVKTSPMIRRIIAAERNHNLIMIVIETVALVALIAGIILILRRL